MLFPFNLIGLGAWQAVALALFGPWLLVWLPPAVLCIRPGAALGMALPGLVLVAAWDDRILRHEFAHIRQMRRWSPLGISLALGWHYGRTLLLGQRFRAAYASNPVEQAAVCEAKRGLPLLRHFRPGYDQANPWREK